MPLERAPSVLLFALDGLRADRLAACGGEGGVMPWLDERARDAVVFSRAVAPATLPQAAWASILTGLAPHAHGYPGAAAPPRGAKLLAQEWRRARRRTAGFAGNPVLGPFHGLSRGFETFVGAGLGCARPSAVAAWEAAAWMSRLRPRDSFFLFVHGTEATLPFDDGPVPGGWLIDDRFAALYNAPPGERGRVAGLRTRTEALAAADALRADAASLRRIARAYDQALGRGDRALAGLWAALKAAARDKDTLVAVTAAHGMELGEEGLGAGGRHCVHDRLIRVPLLLWHPSLRARRVNDPVALASLGAALLELAGAGGRRASPLGALARGERVPLPPAFASSVVSARGAAGGLECVCEGPWKLVYDKSAKRERLLRPDTDPAESRDWSAEHPEIVERLMSRLAAHHGRAVETLP